MWSRIGSWFRDTPPIQRVNIHHNKKKLAVQFGRDDFDVNGRSISVGALRRMLATRFGLPVEELILYQVQPQRKLGNDKATLDEYGVANDGELLAVHRPPPAPPAPPAPPPTPQQQVEKVLSDLENDLGDKRRAFVASPPKDPAQREQAHRVLTEVILAKIIGLDNVDVGDDQDARQARKSAINTLHGFHHEVDRAYEEAGANRATTSDQVPVSEEQSRQATEATSTTSEPQPSKQEPKPQDQPSSSEAAVPQPSKTTSKSKKKKGRKYN